MSLNLRNALGASNRLSARNGRKFVATQRSPAPGPDGVRAMPRTWPLSPSSSLKIPHSLYLQPADAPPAPVAAGGVNRPRRTLGASDAVHSDLVASARPFRSHTIAV